MGEDNREPKDDDIAQTEERHLASVLCMVQKDIDQALKLVDSTEVNYRDFKTYMTDNRGELDPSEQYQNELHLADVDRQSGEAALARTRLAKLLDSPYFARIDFAAEGEPEATPVYIGRFSYSHESQSIISDWRSPVAALFYDFDSGPACYDAPVGRIDGVLTGKRQIEITQGKLLYAVATGSSVRDEILQRELGKTSDQKMKSIISSIQREQNRIIRDETAGSLIIQGVAGSGKTSIALHRIAYLLYRRKGALNSNSVAILSPNKVFGDYISTVLPELGEEPIREFYLRDICEDILGAKLAIQAQRSFIDDDDPRWQERARFKGSLEFSEAIDAYLASAVNGIFRGEDTAFGRYTLPGSWLDERFYRFENLPVNERIDAVVSDVLMQLNTQLFKVGTHAMPTRGTVRTQLKGMLLAKDGLALYRKFFADTDRKSAFKNPAKQTIEWEDACPLVLFDGFFNGYDTYVAIGHLVVDEMQDLTPVQHKMLACLFSCEKTILGDYHQMLDPGNVMTLERMQTIYDDTRVIVLARSYRSTLEIMDLAKRVKNIPEIESVARHGEVPRIVACGNTKGVLDEVERAIRRFDKHGHKTLGILHKSDELAVRYHELLSRDHDVHLIAQDATTFENGISVASIKMAKGLEFDEVVVLDADVSQYSSEFDRNLLYVAITRAMHDLTILYRSQESVFLFEGGKC